MLGQALLRVLMEPFPPRHRVLLIYSCKWLILKILLSELGPQHPYLFTFHFHNLSVPRAAGVVLGLLAPWLSIPVQDEAQDVSHVLCHTVPCHAMPHSDTCPLHSTHVPHTLGSVIDTSSASARSPLEHPPGPSTLHSPVPVRRQGPGRILLVGGIMRCLFVSTFPLCNLIRQAVVLLIQWCLIFNFLKYHKWMGRQRTGDPLYMSSNTYLNI